MKKTILNFSLLIAILATTSCKNEAKTDSETSNETTTTEESIEKEEDKKEESVEANTGVPSFSDPKVQDYVNSYEAYIKEYAKAAESKDMEAFAALGTKGQELGTKAQEVLGNVSGDDVKKLNDYMQTKATQLQELSSKFMQ